MAKTTPSDHSKRFGLFLADLRQGKGMTLRGVEEATEKEISNGYLSQLEKGRVSQPSPNILYSLSNIYGVGYDALMEKAGYISTANSNKEDKTANEANTNRYSIDSLSAEEEEQLRTYLALIRSRSNKN